MLRIERPVGGQRGGMGSSGAKYGEREEKETRQGRKLERVGQDASIGKKER